MSRAAEVRRKAVVLIIYFPGEGAVLMETAPQID